MRTLITGASGQLGAYLIMRLRAENVPIVAWSGSKGGELFGIPLRPVDVTDPAAVADAFREARPAVVIHCAAVTSVAQCHRDPEWARRVNVVGTSRLASLCSEVGAHLVLVSTDLVFDGTKGNYREGDEPAPLSVYGRTKAEAERVALEAQGTVVRVSLLYGPPRNGRPSFFSEQLAALRERRQWRLFADEWRTPLDLDSAARGLLVVAQSGYRGMLHLGGPERMTRLEMGRRVAAALGYEGSTIVPARRSDLEAAEPRPRDTSLDCSRFDDLFPHCRRSTLEEALRVSDADGVRGELAPRSPEAQRLR